jgi:hypothetical protein
VFSAEIIRRMKPIGSSLDQTAELLAVVDALQTSDRPGERARVRSPLDAYVGDTAERRARLVEHLGTADGFRTILRDH